MENHESKDTVKLLMEEVRKNRGRNIELVRSDCTRIKAYGIQNNDAETLGFSYYCLGETYYIQNDIDKMIQNMTKAISYLVQSGQWELLAMTYNFMAIVSATAGNATAAMDYYLEGMKLCQRYGISNVERRIQLNLGYLYLQNKEYDDARVCFHQAHHNYMAMQKKERHLASLTMIYTNLANCYMRMGDLKRTGEYIDSLARECEPHFENIDYIYVGCMKAQYYHLCHDFVMSDICIDDIHRRISEKNVLVIDIFDDLNDLCQLLLEIDRSDVLWDIIDRMEEPVERTGLAYMQRRLLSLKMRYYRKNGKEKEFLQDAGRFYELSEIIEKENQNMITNMLYVRGFLERINENYRELEAAALELVKKSETDQLTGLANRYRLNDYSEQLLRECLSNGHSLAYEILDIDYFKQYNDNYGHQEGDECVKAVARLLEQMQSEQIFCARYGGDEFIIIYCRMSAKEVYEKAEKLRNDVINLNREHLYSKAHSVVTISQGICYDVPAPGNKSWDFLHQADMLLYRVKKTARNHICMGDIRGQEIVTEE